MTKHTNGGGSDVVIKELKYGQLLYTSAGNDFYVQLSNNEVWIPKDEELGALRNFLTDHLNRKRARIAKGFKK